MNERLREHLNADLTARMLLNQAIDQQMKGRLGLAAKLARQAAGLLQSIDKADDNVTPCACGVESPEAQTLQAQEDRETRERN